MPKPQANNAKNDEYRALDRRVRVAALYLQGKTQQQIALALGCSQPTVSNDLAALRAEWVSRAGRDYETRLAEELAKLDALEAAAWDAYRRSCRAVVGGGRVAPRPGDARYLERAAWCVETRLKVLGVFKSTQVNVTQNVVNWDALYGRPDRLPSQDIEDRIAAAGVPALPAVMPPREGMPAAVPRAEAVA